MNRARLRRQLRLRRQVRLLGRSDDGVGLILVIGMSLVIFGLVFTAIALSTSALSQSRQRSSFELALTAAENGIDVTLARLQEAYDARNADYPVPGNQNGSACVGDSVELPTPQDDPFASEAAERDWAKGQLETLASQHPECIVETDSGDYLVLKPETPMGDSALYRAFGRVYSMGWSPSRDAAGAKVRLVKSEYIFMPYAPAHAILTGSDLNIAASTYVSSAGGFNPTLAKVHANGVITIGVNGGGGNPTVTGEVSSTGDSGAVGSNNFSGNPGGQVVQQPTVDVPEVNAESFYFHAPNNDSAAVTTVGWWKTLCPDGTVRKYVETDTICGPNPPAGELLGGITGVTYVPDDHLWIIDRNATSGVYYAYRANVDVGTGNAEFNNMTVVATAENPGDCAAKRYGNIWWDHYGIKAPGFNNMFMYADSDLVTTPNFYAGSNGANGTSVLSGMFVAGDQVRMETSSQGAVGSVIAADQCNPQPPAASESDERWEDVILNEVKNPEVFFDPRAKAPFSNIINQTLWLEYTG